MSDATGRHCKRCGHCCERFFIAATQAQLAKAYDDWVHQRGNSALYQYEIFLLYPMLRHIEDGDGGSYYRCVHLERKGKIATCGIHDIKPWVCSAYPRYVGHPITKGKAVRERVSSDCVFYGEEKADD